MSPWSREVSQMLGAAMAAVGLALIALAFHGPLVAAGVLLVLLGLTAVAVGYVGVQGPPPGFPPSMTDAEVEAAEVEALLERSRQPEPDLYA